MFLNIDEVEIGKKLEFAILKNEIDDAIDNYIVSVYYSNSQRGINYFN